MAQRFPQLNAWDMRPTELAVIEGLSVRLDAQQRIEAGKLPDDLDELIKLATFAYGDKNRALAIAESVQEARANARAEG